LLGVSVSCMAGGRKRSISSPSSSPRDGDARTAGPQLCVHGDKANNYVVYKRTLTAGQGTVNHYECPLFCFALFSLWLPLVGEWALARLLKVCVFFSRWSFCHGLKNALLLPVF
jgi:hypothetical protein